MLTIPSYLEGSWQSDGGTEEPVLDKYTGKQIATAIAPDRTRVAQATRALAAAQERRRLTPYQRYEILDRAADLVNERAARLEQSVMTDTGFPRADAKLEVERAEETLRLSAAEARRLTGHTVPLDAAPSAPRRWGFTLRVPVGVVCAITPFNSPLNTVLHKVAPAIAAGNAVVVKPSLYTPMTANLMVELLLDAGLPPDQIAVLHGQGSTVGAWLLENNVPAFYAFTGSTRVGTIIRQTIGVRRAQLELGSLSSTIVCADGDLEHAARSCVNAGFRKAGQVCTSVQRLYVHEAVADDFTDVLEKQLSARVVGDPSDPATDIGPLISEESAVRVQAWLDEAVAQGAAIHFGGGLEGRVVRPAIVTNASLDMKLMSEELFGPAVSIRRFSDLDRAIAEANETPYGLAAGIFTSDIGTALDAAEQLRVGTVHINEASSNRVDLMPFGGVKASGEGKEGPAYAIAEMTEERLITIGRP